jgi:hypothetical protein
MQVSGCGIAGYGSSAAMSLRSGLFRPALAAEFFEVREEFVFGGSGCGDQFLHLFASGPEGF